MKRQSKLKDVFICKDTHFPANDLAVDVKVEHAAFVSCANTQLTALGENGGILKANANSEKR